MDSGVEKRTVSKVFWRLMPFLGLLYIVAFLDRVNVGYAALSMNKDLGFSSAVYGLGAGIFFIGYFIMEVPGNLIMTKVGARLWIARILITWGIISGLTAWVSTRRTSARIKPPPPYRRALAKRLRTMCLIIAPSQ